MGGVLCNVNRIVGVILCSLLSMDVVSLLNLIYSLQMLTMSIAKNSEF
jgi:hypothetical protein